MTETSATLVNSLSSFQLLPPDQLTEVSQSLLKQCPEPRALAGELVKRRWLTHHQATLLLSGKAQELLLGSYVVLERLGEGGMGSVVKARHQKLDRVVAVKMIRKDKDGSPDAVRRFRREIQAASRLAHPNIVQALDADQNGDTLFLVMELVEGTDLARLVKKNGAMPIGQACNAIRQAALGLQHAHEKGLVHRDIKPANLMVSKTGVIKIADLGLACWRRDENEESASRGITREGSVIGTVDYVAPEQATDSRSVDIRADLYSLGCAFYYLLTAQVPFPGGQAIEKLYRHRFEEPKPLAELRPEIPAAIVDVVQRLMAKKPEDRYQTPAALADDLEQLMRAGLKGPAAKPRAPKGRGRRRVLYVASAALVPLLVGAWFLDPFAGSKETAASTPVKLSIQPTAAPTVAPTQVAVIPPPVWPAPATQPRVETPLSKPPILTPHPPTAASPTGERRLNGHSGMVTSLALSPDGNTLLSGSTDQTLRLWDWRTGNLLRTLTGHKEPIHCAVFSPDGARIASAGGLNWDGKDIAIRIWDASTAAELKRLAGHSQHASTLLFTADGRKLLSGSLDKDFRLWDMDSGKDVRPPKRLAGYLFGMAMTPDGAHVFAAGRDKAAWLLDMGSGEVVRSFSGHAEPIYSVAVSADGAFGVTASGDRTVRLWNLKTGDEVRSYEGHTDGVNSVVFSRDGTRLLSAGRDRTIRLWDTRTGREITRLSGHNSHVRRAIFTPDERGVISACEGLIAVWPLPR